MRRSMATFDAAYGQGGAVRWWEKARFQELLQGIEGKPTHALWSALLEEIEEVGEKLTEDTARLLHVTWYARLWARWLRLPEVRPAGGIDEAPSRPE